jgi:hypothetical protein
MAYDHLEIEARWGTILGEDNERMSKSRGNVVNPDDIGREYGADALRLYEMFMGPLEAVKPWQTSHPGRPTEWWPSRWRRTGARNPGRCGARVAYGINASGDGDDGAMHRVAG